MSTRFLQIPLLVALVASCASTTPKRVPGQEYLAKIDVEGNEAVKDKYVLNGLALKRTRDRGRPPDPYVVDTDVERIKGDYVRRGYLDADVQSKVERQGDAATVIFTVKEGPRATTRVAVYGLRDLALVQKVKDALPLKDGQPFNYVTYDDAKDALRTVVEDAGYAHVKLTAQVIADRATNVAIVTLSFETGPLCTFGAIKIEGVEGELRDAVENRLFVAPGQTYSTSALAQSTRALYGLNRFSVVRVTPEKGDETSQPAQIGVTVAVAESARREIKLGGGFGVDPSAYEVRGRAGYTIAGWPTSLNTFSADLRPAYAKLREQGGYEPRIKALVRLERQDLLWTYAKGDIEGGYDYLAYEAFTAYGPRARLGFSTPLTSERFQLRVGWMLQQASFRNPHPLIEEQGIDVQIGLDETERVGAFTQSLILDLRDDAIQPTYGFFSELRAMEGGAYAAGTDQFIQFVPELRGYVPLGNLVIAAHGRGGLTFGDLPVTQRYFSGGASSQRGFSDRKLSPSAIGDVDGKLKSIPYGGGGLLEMGVELRIPITTIRKMPLGAVTFLDGADVAEKYTELDPMNLHWAAGLGLRLLTIIGPVRLDVGYRLNRTGGMNPDPDSKFAFHFGIGEAF